MINGKLLEHLVQSGARAHGDHGVFFLVAFPLCLKLAVLFAHVLDLQVVQFAEAQRHLQDLSGRVRMHVHLDHIGIIGRNDRIADPRQVLAKAIEIGLAEGGIQMNDKKFRAIPVGNTLLRKL